MAELDYAFIADFASVESGKLTAVGASYTVVRVPSFPAMHPFAVAGRVRAEAGANNIDIKVTIQPPLASPAITIQGKLTPDDANPMIYDGKIGILFALMNVVMLVGPGLAEVLVEIDGQQLRRLAFDVQQA